MRRPVTAAMAAVVATLVAALAAAAGTAGCACEHTIGLNGGDGASEVGDSIDDSIDDPGADEAYDTVDTLPETLIDTEDVIVHDPVPDMATDDTPVDDTLVDDTLVDDTTEEDPGEVELPDPYNPIEHFTMDLLAAVESIPISSDPLTLAVPDATRRDRWGFFLDYLLAGNYTQAYSRAIMYEIEVFAVTDTGTTPNRDYLIAYDPNHGEGIYVFSVTAGHPLVVEVPYPLDDVGTRAEGVEILRQADGWALIMAGTTRCARTDTVICDGTTIACGATPSNYRYSDVAHQPNLIFQTIHKYLSAKDPLSISVQLQGQADSSAAYAIVSDGTTIHDMAGISVELRNWMRVRLSAYSSDIRSCNDSADASGYTSGCQVTNVQGRSSNGSASPCNVAAIASTNRFVVLELSAELRDPPAFPAMAEAVAGLFP